MFQRFCFVPARSSSSSYSPGPFCLPAYLLAGLLVLGLLFFLTAPAARAQETPRFHASVLMYHHVSNRSPPSTSVSRETFIEHLNLLESEGFTLWPLDRIVTHLQRRRPLPDKIAAITFDDAYASVYEVAMPLLKERDWPFTIFVNAKPINRGHALYMNWEQLKEAKAQGALIANHSLTHPHMIRQEEEETLEDWQERMRYEVEENQRQLRQQLGDAPKLFAYPYGEFNPALEKILKDLGYVAFGQQSGPASPFSSLQALPRYAANGLYSNSSSLRIKLQALPFPVLAEEPASGVLAVDANRPELRLQLAEGDYRLEQLRCYGPDAQTLAVKSWQAEGGRIQVKITPNRRIEPGRSRYNCTAPHVAENRWFWFSRQWMLPYPSGRWYEE